MKNNYDANSINILSLREHIRKRPGMYITGLNENGIFHLFREALDNSIDEYVIDNSVEIFIRYNKDLNEFLIADTGRGIPTGYRKDINKDILIALVSEAFTGGKFNSDNYQNSSGMNGSGLKIINALSEKFSIQNNKTKIKYSFVCGEIKDTVFSVENSLEKYSTIISFIPDKSIFDNSVIDNDIIEDFLKTIASLNPNINIKYSFIQNKKEEILNIKYEKIFTHMIVKSRERFLDNEELISFDVNDDKVNIHFEGFKSTNQSLIYSYVNNVHTVDNGEHISAVIDIILLVLYRLTGKRFPRNMINTGNILIVSVKWQEPLFRGQAKNILADINIYKYIYNNLYESIYKEISNNKKFFNYLKELLSHTEKAIDEINVKDTIKVIKNSSNENKLPAKLSAVYKCKPEDRELIIIEGDSAAGSTKSARNPSFQETLPIRGKLINAFKARYSDTTKSQEVMDIFKSVGAVEGSNTQLRTHTVLILADADSDGCHINSLVASLFVVLFPSFIKKYRLGIIHTPLFIAVKGDNKLFGHNTKKLISDFKKKFGCTPDIQRNKGIGELSPEDLYPFLHPDTRKVTWLKYTENSFDKLDALMGQFADIRKEILNSLQLEEFDENTEID